MINQLIAEYTYTTTTYAGGIDESQVEFAKISFARRLIQECADIAAGAGSGWEARIAIEKLLKDC